MSLCFKTLQSCVGCKGNVHWCSRVSSLKRRRPRSDRRQRASRGMQSAYFSTRCVAANPKHRGSQVCHFSFHEAALASTLILIPAVLFPRQADNTVLGHTLAGVCRDSKGVVLSCDPVDEYSAVDTDRQGVQAVHGQNILGLRGVADRRIAMLCDHVQGATPECDRHWKSIQLSKPP